MSLSIILILILLFLISTISSDFVSTSIDSEYFGFGTKNLSLSYDSSTPFSVHITQATGNSNMRGIFLDEACNNPIDFSVKINDRKLILIANHPSPGKTYFLNIRCAGCGNYIQIRQENQTGIIQLTHRISNYEFINSTHNTTFILPNSTRENYAYTSDVYIWSLNCHFDMVDPYGNAYNDIAYSTFTYTASHSSVSFTMIASHMQYSGDTECRVVIDVTYYDEVYKTVLMEIPIRSYHKFKLKDRNTPLMFITSVNNVGKFVYPYFDFPNEGLFQYECTGDVYDTHPVSTGVMYSFVTRAYSYLCKVSPLTDDAYHYNFTVVIREGAASYPIFFHANQFVRDFAPFQLDKPFYTNIYTFTGKLVVYIPRAVTKTCVRIRTHTEKDSGAYWNTYVDPGNMCIQGESIINENVVSVYTFKINEDYTAKCKEGCELHVVALLNVPLPDGEDNPSPIETNTNYTHRRGMFENMLMYLQKEGDVTHAYFNEPIVGSFVSEEDIIPMFYSVVVPYQIRKMVITFERYKNNIELYIKKGKNKPSMEDYDWKITETIETSLTINYIPSSDDDNDNEYGSLRGETFTLMLHLHQYRSFKSDFKVLFVPQYPLSPVETSTVILGESNICNIDNVDHMYCVFMIFLRERIALNGWSFFIEFPYDNSLQADAIYIRTLPYDLLTPHVFTYLDNNVERLFPTEHTSHTVKLDKGVHVYYDSGTTMDAFKLVLVKVQVSRPAIAKMHTTRYFNKLKFSAPYFLEKQYHYIPRNKEPEMKVQLEKGINAEVRVVYPLDKDATILDASVSSTVEGNSLKFNIIKSESAIVEFRNMQHDVAVYVASYEDREPQPEFIQYALRHDISFADSDSHKYMMTMLPKGKNINVHIYVENTTSLYVTPCNVVDISAYVISHYQYKQIMDNKSSMPKNLIPLHVECDTHVKNAYFYLASANDSINYLYVTLSRNTLDKPKFDLRVMKQDASEISEHFVSSTQPIQAITVNNTVEYIAYPLKHPHDHPFTVNINANVSMLKHLHFFNVSSYASMRRDVNESWYVDSSEVKEDGMVVHIVKDHPYEMVIVFGFVFGEVERIKYEVSISEREEEMDLSFLIPIGVGVVCLVVTLALFSFVRLRKRKLEKLQLNEEGFGLNSDCPTFISEDNKTQRMSNVEKPGLDNKSIMQWDPVE